jgi:hypothetical protein
MTQNAKWMLRIYSWKARVEAYRTRPLEVAPKISLSALWNPETDKILRSLWHTHTPAEIAEAVKIWHENYARSKGRIYWRSTSDAGVMYRAAKLRLITKQKASAFHKEVKKERARSHHINPKLRLSVLERDGRKCLLCGATQDLEIDHVIPVTDGGKSEIENLQTLCHRCHHADKGSLHVDFRKPFVKEHCRECHRDHYKNI